MNIGGAAQASGVNPKTIRYYESIGLLPEPKRAVNGYRTYGRGDVETLRFIQTARHLGFSVRDVASLLDLWHDRRRASADVKRLARRQIDAIESRIEGLREMRDTLLELSARCSGDDRPECPILERLAAGETGADVKTGDEK